MISFRDDAQQWPVNGPEHLFRVASASWLRPPPPPPPQPWVPIIVITFHPTSDGPGAQYVNFLYLYNTSITCCICEQCIVEFACSSGICLPQCKSTKKQTKKTRSHIHYHKRPVNATRRSHVGPSILQLRNIFVSEQCLGQVMDKACLKC